MKLVAKILKVGKFRALCVKENKSTTILDDSFTSEDTRKMIEHSTD